MRDICEKCILKFPILFQLFGRAVKRAVQIVQLRTESLRKRKILLIVAERMRFFGQLCDRLCKTPRQEPCQHKSHRNRQQRHPEQLRPDDARRRTDCAQHRAEIQHGIFIAKPDISAVHILIFHADRSRPVR